ncbi:hypothetical protein MHYP_G00034350 [Metynnis hypsauchen]
MSRPGLPKFLHTAVWISRVKGRLCAPLIKNVSDCLLAQMCSVPFTHFHNEMPTSSRRSCKVERSEKKCKWTFTAKSVTQRTCGFTVSGRGKERGTKHKRLHSSQETELLTN